MIKQDNQQESAINRQDTKSLHQLRLETVRLRRIARSKRVKICRNAQDLTENQSKYQRFSELLKSERFLMLKAYFETVEKSLLFANEHKLIQGANAQKASFLAACVLWWEEQDKKTSKDEDFPPQIQCIFEGLDNALERQKARRNHRYSNWKK